MRTTLTIDDDVLAVARALASSRGTSLGSAVSALARRGFQRPIALPEGGDATVFTVRDDAKAITNEDVYKSLADWP